MENTLSTRQSPPLRYIPIWLRVPIAIFIGHKFVTVGVDIPLLKLFVELPYWIALFVSAGVALAMVEYIHRLTVRLDRKVDWHTQFGKRLWQQALFCLVVPCAFTFLVLYVYFTLMGVPERAGGYFSNEFQFACLLYLVMNVCYWGMNNAAHRARQTNVA